MKPIVSVVIPAYNEEKNIGRLLRSIEKQTVRGVETIVIDDASNDATVLIAKKYTQYVFTRRHAERSVQRNFGAEKAKGKYLLFIDADMELTRRVIESCVDRITNHKGLIIPEKTVGKGYMAKVRMFEREMYMGDRSVEVARFYPQKVFIEFGGYDTNLTGTEDYDLPKRIMDKYGASSIGWAKEYILHHESGLTLSKQLKKKFYYAQKSAHYAKKYPNLISRQGILIWRKAYLRNWLRFVKHPVLGLSLLLLRLLETFAAALGYLSAVGPIEFIKTLFLMVKYSR